MPNIFLLSVKAKGGRLFKASTYMMAKSSQKAGRVLELNRGEILKEEEEEEDSLNAVSWPGKGRMRTVPTRSTGQGR